MRDHIFIIGASPKITDNIFFQPSPGGSAILLDPQVVGNPQISHNDFELLFQPAIKVVTGSEQRGGEVDFNNFGGNSLIEIPCDSKLKFSNNQIRGTVKMSHSGNCVGKLIFGPNYWFSIDKEVILKEKFMNKELQFIIEIPELLTKIPKSGRRMGRY